MNILDIEDLIATISDENIGMIEEYANKLMPIPDIAVLLRIAPSALSIMIQEGNNAVADAYARGKAKRVLELHEKEIELAGAGSAQSIANLHTFLNKMDAAEN